MLLNSATKMALRHARNLGVGKPSLLSSINGCVNVFNKKKNNGDYAYRVLNTSSSVMSDDHKETKLDKIKESESRGFLSPESCHASPNHKYSRWLMFAPAFATHVALGAPYGWSAISAGLSKHEGFVSAATSDWSLDLCTYPMSVMIFFGGLSAAALGNLTMKLGHRKSMAVGGSLFGLGFATAALGLSQHNLPLIYAGNLLCGVGYGFAYTPPIQAVLDWFPERRGLASGIVIAGFGSGGIFFSYMAKLLQQKFAALPTYLGPDLTTVAQDGKQFAQIGSELQEVVYATTSEIAKLPVGSDVLQEGFYLANSGSTGIVSTLLVLAGIYGSTVVTSALLMRKPPVALKSSTKSFGDVVDEKGQGKGASPKAEIVSRNVTPASVMKTPQFYLLFATSTLLCTGGMGLISVANPMISEVFTGALPSIVTATFASSYLMAMSGGNALGRVFWAGMSDKIGRRNTFFAFTGLATPIFASLPFLVNQVVSHPESPLAPFYLMAFCGSAVISISVMGGVFAVLPAYEADLFGPKYVQAIHGRFLIAASLSTVLGPAILLKLRRAAESKAIDELLPHVDPVKFSNLFGGMDISQTPALIESKALTISKLMTLVPSHVVDPSPFLYNQTMYSMAFLAGSAALLHSMVKPVDAKHFEKSAIEKSKKINKV